MTDQQKELARKIGEETIYTAKGYFKCFDIASMIKNLLLWINLILMVITVALVVFDCCSMAQKGLMIASLLVMVVLLYLDGKCSDSYLCECKVAANQYLSLHKKIRNCYFTEDEDVKSFAEEARRLDSLSHPRIHLLARWMSKLAIEKFGEVDLWYK